MKNYLLCFALLFVVTTTNAQVMIGTISRRPEKMKILVPMAAPAVQLLRAGGPALAPGLLPPVPAGTTLDYVGESATDYLVRIPRSAPAALAAFSSGEVYSIAKTSAQKVNDPLEGAVSVTSGVATFPFKYRPKNGERSATIEPSFSLSVVAGPSWKLPKTEDTYFRLLFGIGTSSISLNAKNTDPIAGITEEVSRPAATFSSTLIFETSKIQFAVSMGTDLNFDNSDDRWIYQGNAWFSAGIGFNIFAASEE